MLIVALTVLIAGCGELWKLVPIDPGHKPVILDSYASQNVKPGTVWKILVEAEDKDGDMKKIVAAIAPGPQSFPHLFLRLYSGRRRERTSCWIYLCQDSALTISPG